MAVATSPALMPQVRHLLRIEPDADAVVALAEDNHVRNAVHPQQFVAEVDRRVVAQVDVVVSGLFEHMLKIIRMSGVRLRMEIPWFWT